MWEPQFLKPEKVETAKSQNLKMSKPEYAGLNM